ncbi:helix-turn-helix transcriptional regulator [Sandarakinorhabdus sp. AAP62]|uniref:helix-turn-helix domain-containing protein n=1 Tax=Sandarakinorhabdus sp. AAP62 TaxID=1248916 RepID=UPI000372D205|nr:helix-turn-helix transcriptional regulator [Sandarakinorhabdus sp. AAP62]
MANDSLQKLRTQFGRLVSAKRRERGWTQDDLSSHAQISVDMISRIEAGATGARFTTIAKLATALGVEPEELFSPRAALDRPKLNAIVTRLARLSDDDLDWLDDVLAAVLKHR